MRLNRRRALAALAAAAAAATTIERPVAAFAQELERARPRGNPDADFEELRRDYLVGIGIAGLEYGTDATTLPGRLGRQYFAPDDRLAYLARRGIRSVRLPFRWERLQPRMFGELDAAYLQLIKRALTLAGRNGQKILLDPHNYESILVDGVPRLLGSQELPTMALADLWTKLAHELADSRNALMGFDILNEPSKRTVLSETAWVRAAQETIDAIRQVDEETFVFVEGWGHASPFNWGASNPNLHTVRDPADRLVISMHQYFDGGNRHRGTYDSADGSYAGEGGDREMDLVYLRNYTDWLKTHGRRGHVGEFGAPNTPDWLDTMSQFMDALVTQGILFHAWGAFLPKSNYITQLTPEPGGPDRLQASLIFSKLPRR